MASWWTPGDAENDFGPATVAPFLINNEVKLNALGKTFGHTVRCVNEIMAQLPGPRHSFDSMTDQEGNRYMTIVIVTQTWMAENFRATKYKDGTEIPNESISRWSKLKTTPVYASYQNNPEKYRKRKGGLYNFFAVETTKLSPSGWHLPTKDEWNRLGAFLSLFDFPLYFVQEGEREQCSLHQGVIQRANRRIFAG